MSNLQEAISSNLSKIKFDSPQVHSTFEEMNYPPTFSLTDKQLKLLKNKKVGDKCEFEVEAKITSTHEGGRYQLEVTSMEYKGKGLSEHKTPMESAYDNDESKKEEPTIVKLATEPLVG